MSVKSSEWLSAIDGAEVERALREATEAYEREQDAQCAKGVHGFNTQTWLGGGRIHTRCTRCGAHWSRPDIPI